jgi:murE/murF fusion protein
MRLGNLLKFTSKNLQKIFVDGISFDSRKVKKNNIFFAIHGNQTSGNKFINEAISKGAAVIISDKKIKEKKLRTPFLLVKDVRKSLTEACSNFYKKKPQNIIAVTGTNGKSSVCNFFYQILSFNRIPVASLGTLGIVSPVYKKKMNLTSMDPLFLHKNLEKLAKNKINYAILEASSHGLKQKRLDNLNIKNGIFTNFSQDHLDYHKNMKSYLNSKMYLFNKLLKKNSKIISDQENKEFKILKKISKKRKIKQISIGTTASTLNILHNSYKGKKQIIKISIHSKVFLLEIPLIGYFQIKNLLMSVLAAIYCGIDKNKIFKQIHKIKPVPGRLECVASLNNNSNVIVDFAHTPGALEQSLIALKKQFNKKIILVFGCGGDRDKKKRFLMGKIAEKHCRKIFITDDNPRNESPKKIRKAIKMGCKKLSVDIGNRKKAIQKGLKELRPNEILLVAGKGHENTQDYGNKIINFSDKKIIKELIDKKKYKNFLLTKVFDNNNLKDVNFNGVSINTRTIKKKDLFFALSGKKNDGHKFVREAIKKGAVKSIISKKIKKFPKNKIIKVKNTFSSLNTLAKVIRDNTSAHIIGITGSVGKTTLKDLTSFALKNYGKVHYSPHSYNNKFGVPLSVSNLKKDTEYGVFEIGMDKKGEINNLSKIVRPEIGIITNISGAHFKNFNTLKDIAKAKSEIINNILEKGNIILNKDDKFFNFLSSIAKKNDKNVISFSAKKSADIFLQSIKKIKKKYRLKIIVNKKIFYFYVKYCVDSFINNILACISVLFILNLDLKKMENGFINFLIPTGRGDISIVNKFKKKFKFIDESYNANPLSMSSAIKNMSIYKRKNNSKKLVLLSDMLELGKQSIKLHKKLSIVINRSDIDKVFVYGKHIKETFNYLSKNKKGKVFNNLKEAYDHFSKILHNNDLLMIKGSNATGLNQFSKNIKKRKISAI